MEERYNKLFSIPEDADDPKIPVKVIAGAVYFDRITFKTLIQLKLQNNCSYNISTLKVTILLFDKSGEKIRTEISHVFQSLNIKKGEQFGEEEPIIVSDLDNIGSVQINVMYVSFTDESDWKLGQDISIIIAQKTEAIIEEAKKSIKTGEPQKAFDLIINLPDDCACKTEYLNYAKSAIKEKEYNELLKFMNEAKTEYEFNDATERFIQLGKYKDSERFVEECEKKVIEIHNDVEYEEAKQLMIANSKAKVILAQSKFKQLGDWRDSEYQAQECSEILEKLYKKGKKRIIVIVAVFCFAVVAGMATFIINDHIEKVELERKKAEQERKAEEARKAEEKRMAELEEARKGLSKNQGSISTNSSYTVGVKKNRKIIATPVDYKINDYGQTEIGKMKNVVSVSAGGCHTVGLKENGTVVSTKVVTPNKDYVDERDYGQTEVDEWMDIVAISAGEFHTVGLKEDGTVVSTEIYEKDAYGDEINSDYDKGQSNVEDWSDIVAISAEYDYTVGLKKDGTVVTTIEDDYDPKKEAENWEDIIAISGDNNHIVGLKKDNTVVSTETEYSDQDSGQTNVGKWNDIIAVSAGFHHTVGLKKDGTVVSTKIVNPDNDTNYDFGQTKVDKWKNIVGVYAGDSYTLALKKDGTVAVTNLKRSESDIQPDVDGWNDILINK